MEATRFEVEMKFREVDHQAVAETLRTLGIEPGPEVIQVDLYLAHPSRDFRVTNEALRLRRDGEQTCITYKGPKLAGPTKTREEIEVPFDPSEGNLEQLATLFERLGFRRVAEVRKTRRHAELEVDGRPLLLALDTVDGLGEFAEVETLASGPADLDRAQAAVVHLAERLELDARNLEPRSYLRMLLASRGEQV